MHKGKSFLGVILARGGSKRLPRKNILDLKGKPLIGWTIDAGLNNKYIDRVIVSSDDDEILKISSELGADILKRPDELASDTASSFDAISHVLTCVEKYDYVVLLQPTSPLRSSQHINEAIELLLRKKADAVISVCEVEHSPLWSNILPPDGSMKNFIQKAALKRGQDLEKYYRLNGAIYISEVNALLNDKTFFLEDKIYAYIMDRKSSIDIDDEVDFRLASYL